MTEPEKKVAWYDPLHPRWGLVFAALVLAGLVVARVPDWPPSGLARWARWAGYLGALAMLVPYVHVWRRRRRDRFFRARRWLRWHVGAAYLALACVLVHTGGRSSSPVTRVLLWTVWVVMASGAIGYYGQMLLYRLLPLVLDREVGRERLEHLSREMGKEGINQRLLLLAHPATLDRKAWKKLRDRLVELKVSPRPEECARRARAFTLDDSKHADQKEALEILHELLTAPARDFEAALERLEQDGHERPRGECLRQLWPVLCPDLPAKTEPGAVERVAEEVLGGSLLRPLSFWGWLRPGRGAAPVSKNHFTRARELADPAQLEALTVLEALVEERRQREIEYRLHALGRAWLLLHGPASVLLLLLLAGHVWVSVRLGGF